MLLAPVILSSCLRRCMAVHKTYFKHTLPRLGIETIFVQNPEDLDD